MKLRLLKINNAIYMYCKNGSILEPSPKDLGKLLVSFSKPEQFKGTLGAWRDHFPNMEDAPGETLAYIDDSLKLVVVNESAFVDIAKTETKYISANEYASIHKKGKAIVKRLCVEGRIEGAYKASSGWLIPENAKYPERKTRTVKKPSEQN